MLRLLLAACLLAAAAVADDCGACQRVAVRD
jgi:hypothetical protein